MLFVIFVGCTELFDISSTVLVRDENQMVHTEENVEFCQRIRTDYTSDDVKEYFVEACTMVDVVDGIADLPNWEGVYRGNVTDIELWWVGESELFPATIVDDDEDVWCDNVDVDTDMNGNTTTTPFCSTNFEFYLLWEIALPSLDD